MHGVLNFVLWFMYMAEFLYVTETLNLHGDVIYSDIVSGSDMHM